MLYQDHEGASRRGVFDSVSYLYLVAVDRRLSVTVQVSSLKKRLINSAARGNFVEICFRGCSENSSLDTECSVCCTDVKLNLVDLCLMLQKLKHDVDKSSTSQRLIQSYHSPNIKSP